MSPNARWRYSAHLLASAVLHGVGIAVLSVVVAMPAWHGMEPDPALASAPGGTAVALEAMTSATPTVATSHALPVLDQSPSATRTPLCPTLAPLLTRCQPPNLSGIVWCDDSCRGSAGTKCRVSLIVQGFAGDSHNPPILPIPSRDIEGWWLVWSERENRRYHIYDGFHWLYGGGYFEYTFCGNACGLRLEGYGWVSLDDSDYFPIEGRGSTVTCADCIAPTPTPSDASAKTPQRCHWQGYLPVVRTVATSPPPTAPATVLSQIGGDTLAVAATGDLAVAGVGMGVDIWDVRDRAAPRRIGRSARLPAPARRIVVHGASAYVVTQDGGLQILDIALPAAPRVLATLDAAGPVESVVVTADGHAYLASGKSGLFVVNVGDPAHPRVRGTLATAGPAHDVAVVGSLAYVAIDRQGLAVVDVSDTTAPRQLAVFGYRGSVRSVHVAGRYAYIGDDYDVRILDLALPTRPQLVDYIWTPGTQERMSVSGTGGVIADGSHGLSVLDMTDPAKPARVGFIDTPDTALDVALSGDVAYVADRQGGLRVVDIATPAAPRLAAVAPDFSLPRAVAIAGSHAFVAADTAGLAVVDIRRPRDPVLVGQHFVRTVAHDVAVAGNVAYVVDRGTDLWIIDVADPSAPRLLANVGLQGHAWRVAAANGRVYVACLEGGLAVVDVADPTEPRILGYHALPGRTEAQPSRAEAVHVVGDVAYVSLGVDGMQLVDVSDPSAPRDLGRFKGSGPVHDVDVEGNTAFVAAGQWGLGVVDVADPAAPERIRHIWPGAAANRVSVADGVAYVAVGAAGVVAVDVRRPADAYLLGSFTASEYTHDVFVAGDIVAAVGEGTGMALLGAWRAGSAEWATPAIGARGTSANHR